MSKPKAVVFDIGNVLLEWDPDRLYKKLIPDDAERVAMFEAVDLTGMNEAIDAGAPFKETIYAKAEAHPKHGDLIRAWHDQWLEMGHKIIDGSWKILKELKLKKIPVLALSNFGVESYEMAQSVYPELCEFDIEFISGRLKVIKPDAKIYQVLEDETGYAGSDLVFFDDREDNIEAAISRGWHGRVFTSPAQMRRDLETLELL